jgi:hypothetical protein
MDFLKLLLPIDDAKTLPEKLTDLKKRYADMEHATSQSAGKETERYLD